jgi:hypothetical protein
MIDAPTLPMFNQRNESEYRTVFLSLSYLLGVIS